jgi:hypothetical protein
MQFIKDIKNSFFNPIFYRELFTKTPKEALKFYFKIVSISAIISFITITILFISGYKFLTSSFFTEALNTYPEELEVNIIDGKVSTNVTEPYFIPLPTKMDDLKKSGYENLVAIDTANTESLSIEGFKSYKALFLITKDSIIAEDNKGKVSVQSLENFASTTVNKVKVANLFESIRGMAPYMLAVLLVLGFIFNYVRITIFGIVLTLVVTFIFFLTMKVRKEQFDFKKLFYVGLYAISGPMIMHMIASILVLRLPFWVYMIALLIILFINIKEQKNVLEQ